MIALPIQIKCRHIIQFCRETLAAFYTYVVQCMLILDEDDLKVVTESLYLFEPTGRKSKLKSL